MVWFWVYFIACLPVIVLILRTICKAVYKRIKQNRQKRKAQAAAEEKARQARRRAKEKAAQAAAAQAEREAAKAEKARKAAEKRAEQQRRAEERAAAAQAKQAAKLEAARQLAEYHERALNAARELRAVSRAAQAATSTHHSESTPAQAAGDPSPAAAQAMTLSAFAAENAPQAFPVACMLAKKYADNPHTVDGKAFTITEKLDGVRCIARVERGRVTLYSRSGNRIEGLTEIENALSSLNMAVMLDGELLINGRGTLSSKDEYKQTCSIVRSSGLKKGIVYHVFDMLPLADYESRRSSIPYSARRASLQRLEGLPCVEVVPVLYAGTDTAQIEAQLQAQREAHHEGIMINLNDAPYSFTRSACLLKYKLMSDCDLQIVAVNQGTGRNAGSLGSLSMDYKGGIVRVSAGIPDALRRAIWNNPTAYIGRVATVQYFEETQDRNGRKSLRFPAFVEMREPGKTVSYA